MSDDALHRDHETASAYLDGELEQDERALAEASPTTMGLVEAFAVVHDRLTDVPSATETARDQAIAAALAEFDALGTPMVAAAMTAPPPAAIPLFKRTGFRIVSAAAAVLLVGVVGIAALNSGGQDDDSSSAEVPAADRAADASTPAPAEASDDVTSGGADVLSATTTIGTITGPASAARQVSSEEQLLALADELAATPADGGETEGDSMAPADTTAGVTEYDAPSPATIVAAGCELSASQVYVTDIIWIDTPAALVIDTDSGDVIAMGADCTVLARATR